MGDTAFTPNEPMKPENFPILKSFYKTESIDDYRRRFFGQANDVAKVAEQFSIYRKAGDLKGMEALRREQGRLLRMAKMAKETKDTLKRLRDQEDVIRANDGDLNRLDVIETREKMLLERFNNRFYQ